MKFLSLRYFMDQVGGMLMLGLIILALVLSIAANTDQVSIMRDLRVQRDYKHDLEADLIRLKLMLDTLRSEVKWNTAVNGRQLTRERGLNDY